eukprot:CAMPEP_0175481072 /NCGR_PEP_ID=MMETSP0095-20121207/78266_1 /TAXON_ID=311494 /ORGANISM="Alexandrium monilatum, Strain CCMP3105" /LENGTH=329 /DNA_ID=CAMNT_0016782703 /DNA_START=40 /DNA_END=1027 /DNA_ORIENTATION=+
MGQCGSMCPAYGADGPCGLDPAECLAKHPRSVPSAGAVSMGDEAQECSYSESSPGRANAVVMRQSGAAKEIPPSAVMRLTPEVLAAIWQELSMCPVDGIPHNSGTPAPPPGPAHHDPDYWRRRPKADALGGRKRHKGLPVIPGHYAQVTLHVYDTSWLAAKTGVPAFHVGVEVLGTEFSFGDMGINCNRPGEYDSTRYRRAVPLGRTDLQDQEILKVLRELQMEWPGEAYRQIARLLRRSSASVLAFPTLSRRNTSPLPAMVGLRDAMGRRAAETRACKRRAQTQEYQAQPLRPPGPGPLGSWASFQGRGAGGSGHPPALSSALALACV